jgi:site-specific DNA recombinase
MMQMTLIDDKTISFFMPLKLCKRGGHKMVIVPEGEYDDAEDIKPEINLTLLNALIKATLWERQFKAGKYETMSELCHVEKIKRRFTQLILKLNFLAPEIKEAILEGRQPRNIKLIDMRGNIPLLWEEQRELYKF